jgi:hypothetical protein
MVGLRVVTCDIAFITHVIAVVLVAIEHKCDTLDVSN